MKNSWLKVIRAAAAASALVALPLASCLRAAHAPVALLPSVEVSGSSILLSNLVPLAAPLPIRLATSKIPLGAAPQFGATREISRAALAAAIAAGGLSPSEFAIPTLATVRRGGRLLSREEIFAAIRSALAKNPNLNFPALRADDLSVDLDPLVPPGDAGLEVTQMGFDPFINRLRFRLWPRRAPGVLPFFVTAAVPASLAIRLQQPALLSSPSHPASPQPQPPAPVLVLPGQPARLHLHSPDLDMLLDVRALQRGHLDEIIRVRLIGTGRIFRGRVTGEAYLDATL